MAADGGMIAAREHAESSALSAGMGTGGARMAARVRTVAFSGIDALPVDVQVQIASGMPAFTIVGCQDPILVLPQNTRNPQNAGGFRWIESDTPCLSSQYGHS
jgi:hypothetical protein